MALLSIINQILDFSRIDAGRIDLEYIPFSIQSLVKDQMKIINPIVTMHKQLNNIDIHVDIDSNLPQHVEGDISLALNCQIMITKKITPIEYQSLQ